MKKLLPVLILVVSVLGLNEKAAAQTKIGYINTEDLMTAMPEAVQANADLQDYQTSLQQQGNEYIQELNEKDSQFVKDSAKLSPAAKELRRNDLVQLYQKVQNWNHSQCHGKILPLVECLTLFPRSLIVIDFQQEFHKSCYFLGLHL